MIWYNDYSLEQINEGNKNSMVEHCGIIITKKSSDSLTGTMPADKRTHQPFGIVHGGANCVLAETLGSIAANMTCNPKEAHAVGLSITTNHIKAVRNGSIKGVAKATHMGRTTQVWEIKTYNTNEQLTSSTTLTMAIVSKLGKS
ncbi:MAG: 1,4-dihydroxy-2-naphthoyl-CoA hydrolase [Bacteriovoracaceae bacterium]|jgi:1,4-dihydroxy-2-naphthoyl-CoA hydrolase